MRVRLLLQVGFILAAQVTTAEIRESLINSLDER